MVRVCPRFFCAFLALGLLPEKHAQLTTTSLTGLAERCLNGSLFRSLVSRHGAEMGGCRQGRSSSSRRRRGTPSPLLTLPDPAPLRAPLGVSSSSIPGGLLEEQSCRPPRPAASEPALDKTPQVTPVHTQDTLPGTRLVRPAAREAWTLIFGGVFISTSPLSPEELTVWIRPRCPKPKQDKERAGEHSGPRPTD